LRDTQSIRDVDNVDPSVGGQQISDRLIASGGLRVLHGHVVLNSSALAANISPAHLVALTECLQKIFESLPMRQASAAIGGDLASDVLRPAGSHARLHNNGSDATFRSSV
jgi:hypothetical protein